MKNVILLSFGKEYEWKRGVFAILSFWSWFEGNKDNVRTIVYTDNPEYFKAYLSDFDITYVHTSLEEIRDIKSKSGGNMFRIKIAVVERTFLQYPEDDLLYVDTDTFFRTNPQSLLEEIKPGQSFMHLQERTFEDAVDWAKWENNGIIDFQQFPKLFIKHIESKSFTIKNQEVNFNRFQFMWNAGVLGLNKEIASYIPNIYALNDEFYDKTVWRLSEQTAFSLVLETVSHLYEAVDYINHYWSYKKQVDLRLKELLTDSFKKLNLNSKQTVVKEFIQKLEKFLYHEKMISQTRDSFREKDFKSALKFGAKVFSSVPLNDDLVKSIKYRFFKIAS